MADLPDNPIRIVILDNYLLERSGLRALIESQPELTVVGETGDLCESLEIIARQKPDIVLLNSNLCGETDLDIIPRLLNSSERSRIILITTIEDSQLFLRAIQEGVLGVVLKTQPPEVLYKAICKVQIGEVWFERSMLANILTSLSYSHKLQKVNPEAERIEQLSNRERQVIRLIGLGLKNQRIANELCISETTVRHHLTSIFNKLGVSDRLELLVFAHRVGLTKTPEQSPIPNELNKII